MTIIFQRYLPILAATLLFSACTTSSPYTPLLNAEPEAGAELSRAPRTLRLFFDALPDVPASSLRLLGPSGEYPLRGLHTMAADDLMIEIMEPLTPGSYTVEWRTRVGEDPSIYSGVYQFTVQ